MAKLTGWSDETVDARRTRRSARYAITLLRRSDLPAGAPLRSRVANLSDVLLTEPRHVLILRRRRQYIHRTLKRAKIATNTQPTRGPVLSAVQPKPSVAVNDQRILSDSSSR